MVHCEEIVGNRLRDRRTERGGGRDKNLTFGVKAVQLSV